MPPGLRQLIYQEGISHLVCDIRCTVFYIPVLFDKVIYKAGFGSICSSISLREELEEIAEKLNLDIGEYTPNIDVLIKRSKEEFKFDFLGGHKLTLLCLYNLVLASISYGSAIIVDCPE